MYMNKKGEYSMLKTTITIIIVIIMIIFPQIVPNVLETFSINSTFLHLLKIYFFQKYFDFEHAEGKVRSLKINLSYFAFK